MIINSIPSSCLSENCTFNFSTEATPLIESVYPSSGQQGTTITVYGSGFEGDSSEGDDVRVWLGGVECVVIAVNDSEISCTVQEHPAGSVSVSVHIPGKGYAAVNDSIVCFLYLLDVTDIQPASGSIIGGTEVTLRGRGFLPSLPVKSSVIGPQLSNVAWLRNGFSWPQLPPLPTLCPYLTDEFVNFTNLVPSDYLTLQHLILYSSHENGNLSDLQDPEELQLLLANFYNDFPLSVFVGSAPCIVTWSNWTDLRCTTTAHPDGTVNITVTVLGETAVLEGYTYDTELTPSVFSIVPDSGPVYGGTVLTIEGRALSNTISVTIGDAPCTIISQNDTDVVCNTTSHPPSSLPVMVTTSQGLARVESMGGSLSGDEESGDGSGDPLVPSLTQFFFRYELEVNSIGPLQGSVLGGLVLTIGGRGFHPSLTSVLIGGRQATVTSASETVVQCIAPPPTQTHIVTFIDEGYSFGESEGISYSTNVCMLTLTLSLLCRKWLPVFMVTIQYCGTAWGHGHLGMESRPPWICRKCVPNSRCWFQYPT